MLNSLSMEADCLGAVRLHIPYNGTVRKYIISKTIDPRLFAHKRAVSPRGRRCTSFDPISKGRVALDQVILCIYMA